MAIKMLHRGSMARLIPTTTNFTLLSTCFLLLIQFQIFHALPTSFLTNNGASNGQDASVIRSASSTSTAYGSAYPYSSYRPGPRLEDSYRPYSAYAKDFSSSGLYAPDHPNSVYSRQSATSSNTIQQNLDKVLKFIEKEIVASDLQQQQSLKNLPGLSNTNDKQETSTDQKLGSLALGNNNTPVRNNTPRLLPLPSIQPTSISTNDETNNGRKESPQHQNINKEQQQSAATSTTASGLVEEKQVRSAEFSPIPPPFAPELDPQYERRQYGLGALTLLDQAGPFW